MIDPKTWDKDKSVIDIINEEDILNEEELYGSLVMYYGNAAEKNVPKKEITTTAASSVFVSVSAEGTESSPTT